MTEHLLRHARKTCRDSHLGFLAYKGLLLSEKMNMILPEQKVICDHGLYRLQPCGLLVNQDICLILNVSQFCY